MGRWLVIEFVPKSDSLVIKLLKSHVNIFDRYTHEDFELVFQEYFIIHEAVNICESERYLRLMQRRGNAS
jgi:hypothetical protein